MSTASFPDNPQFPGSIVDIQYTLPNLSLSNQQLNNEFPEWNVEAAAHKVGVSNRWIAGPSETAFDLAVSATKKLFDKNPELKQDIDAIMFCTQTPDYIMPSNAHLLHNHFKLADRTLAFDYNLACSGYLYGLFLASCLMKSGMIKNVLLVTGDTYSKIIDKRDRATRMLFGDAATATWLSSKVPDTKSALVSKFLDFEFGSMGSGWSEFYVPSGGNRPQTQVYEGAPAADKIHMNGLLVLNFVKRTIIPHIDQFVRKNGLPKEDIGYFCMHQASKLALDLIKNKFSVPNDKFLTNLDKVGNTVSSSLPILIKDHKECLNIARKQNLLISGFGVGYSWGSALAEL